MKKILDRPRLEHPVYETVFWLLVILSCAAVAFGLTVIGLICLAGLLYAGFVEPRLLTVKRFRLDLVKNPRARITVAFLSDLHAGAFKGRRFFERVVWRTLKLKPDVIILGGDLVEDHPDAIADLKSFTRLRAPLGTFFLLGNHDYLDDPRAVREKLLAWRFEDLTNATRVIEKDGTRLELVGLDDSWFGHPDVQRLKTKRDAPRLLVTHEPDALADVERGDADVIVTGHTHGGQVRLPWIGAIAKLPQQVPQSFDRGLKNWRGIPVIISQGLGETDARLRFFCPPQVVVVEVGV